MKFSLDCCHDVLFYLEDNLTITDELELEFVSLEDIISSLGKYKPGELANTLIVLKEAGFIDSSMDFPDGLVDIYVSRITYGSYQFLESIRPETVWNKTKNVGLKIGSFSINTASQIAVGVLTSLINALLGL